MKKYSFKNDYSEGAHENILKAMCETNMEQTTGYGEDIYSIEAKNLIKKRLHNDDSEIHFLVGGTQTNLIMISASLRPFQAVIAANTGHINVHETGAIEATGHKVLAAPFRKDGKLYLNDIKEIIKAHTDEHMVKPKMVYISQATEVGTLYSKEEISNIYNYCKENDLYLFIDGARLGSALGSVKNDVTLKDLSNLSDAFYIGGTKNGALMGEALVINNKELAKDFRYNIKQKGGMFAKGRILGIQFRELFKENLFIDIGVYENTLAMKLKEGLKEIGIEFFVDSYTNQIFPIFEKGVLEKIEEKYEYTFWCNYDKNSDVIRLCTSFATREDMVYKFLEDVKYFTNSI